MGDERLNQACGWLDPCDQEPQYVAHYEPCFDALCLKVTEISTWTGNANVGTGERIEVLWSNRPLLKQGDDARLFEVTA